MLKSRLSNLLPVGLLGVASALTPPSDGLTPVTLYANGINATFIGYGARLTSLYVNDKNGVPRDVVVGYDNPYQYVVDTATNRTFFGAVVGPYANRIKNGSFIIDGVTYNVDKNEHGGLNTLHGGKTGYDTRNWTAVALGDNYVTYSLYDDAGTGGFPGPVQNYATFTLSGNPPTLYTNITSTAPSHITPIMPANHVYWNLGAFMSNTILNDYLWMPYAKRLIETDGIQIPTGGLRSLVRPWANVNSHGYEPLNFTYPKTIGSGSNNSKECGTGCVGIDNAFILDRPFTIPYDSMTPVQLVYTSQDTGIRMQVQTNQGGLQIYDCVGQNGTIPVKASQKYPGGTGFVEKNGCLVIETQDWIDGINQPEWGRLGKQWFGQGAQTTTNMNLAQYSFGIQN